ncbi:NlpC/P60 family protein [Gordonia polyisoprenivorans NBRC 16320 = JCM 10675]|uniref:Uncharacterized protein n=1 Tax=Gordonia polyisoprenivorans TaxID=84595 RepID=A0A846WUH7_9ACTN|nr:hypothetical protein [Gordonia polyisoprenivorans]NKY04051.1 hypothetical protein [Gordonia polyisoprenivorans]GAB26122.1 NlpC/P60 family protein [Gordonia polyisoprenivorans NBRC 16320 = JCM 10675]
MASPTEAVAAAATQMPGYDPGPVIGAIESRLDEYLNTPTGEILSRLGLPVPPGIPTPGPIPGLPALPGLPTGGNTLASIDGGALIQPVLDALGTLGSGVFEALDPTKIFESITSAFSSVASSLPTVISAMQQGWQGEGADAAAMKTAQLGKDGTEVGVQSGKIKGNVVQAGVDTKTTEAHLLEIISQFEATMAVALPQIVTPWGQAMAVAAATDAITRTTAVMGVHKGLMAVNTAEVAADGAPVSVTNAPQVPTEMLSSMVQMGTGLIQPAFGVVEQVFSAGEKIVQSSVQAGTKIGEAIDKAQHKTSTDTDTSTSTTAAPVGLGAGGPAGMGGGGGGSKPTGAGGGGGGGVGVSPVSAPPSSRTSPSGTPPTEESTNSGQQRTAAATTASATTTGNGGYAPMSGMGSAGAGAGAGKGTGSGHTAADFLHTSESGSEIVGDFADVAPAVIGEKDDDTEARPDIDLRI